MALKKQSQELREQKLNQLLTGRQGATSSSAVADSILPAGFEENWVKGDVLGASAVRGGSGQASSSGENPALFCSFEAQNQFAASCASLNLGLEDPGASLSGSGRRSGSTSKKSPIKTKSPRLLDTLMAHNTSDMTLSFHLPNNQSLRLLAAQQKIMGRGAFTEPSAFCHRYLEDLRGEDGFNTTFHLADSQSLRLATARDQGKMHSQETIGSSALQRLLSDEPGLVDDDDLSITPFVTNFALPDNQTLKLKAAKDQGKARGTYKPPSEYQFRDMKSEGSEFLLNFHLDNNQIARLKAAKDQKECYTQSSIDPINFFTRH